MPHADPNVDSAPNLPRDGKGLKSYLAIHQALKREILMGEISPGQALPEVDLAQRFNLSRAPVREALIHLASEGLAASSPHGGYVVPEVSIQELKELYEMRLLLEPEAAERAAKNVASYPEELSALGKWIDVQESHPLNPDTLANQIEAEVGIHTSIARMSGNRLLTRLVCEINERYQRHHVWLFRELWKRKVDLPTKERNLTHREICAALEAGDSQRARALMHQHISKATQVWLTIYFQS